MGPTPFRRRLFSGGGPSPADCICGGGFSVSPDARQRPDGTPFGDTPRGRHGMCRRTPKGRSERAFAHRKRPKTGVPASLTVNDQSPIALKERQISTPTVHLPLRGQADPPDLDNERASRHDGPCRVPPGGARYGLAQPDITRYPPCCDLDHASLARVARGDASGQTLRPSRVQARCRR